MKKAKKLLSVLSAIIVAVTGAMSVSAWSIKSDKLKYDINNIIFSTRKYSDYAPDEPLYGNEFWIDGNYNTASAHVRLSGVIVRMTNDTEPPCPDEEYSVENLSEVQIAGLLDRTLTGSFWGAFYSLNLDNLEITDNLYYIKGFESEQAANEYCQKLLDEKITNYAKPVFIYEYGISRPYEIIRRLEELGVDSSGFSDDSYAFYASFEDAAAAESFDINSIDNFEESLQAKTVKDNTLYFQLKNETEGETAVNILSQLQKESSVKELFPLSMLVLESSIVTIDSIPTDYEYGDVDRNNTINIFDAVAIAKNTVGKVEFDNVQKLLADSNKSGNIDIFDAVDVAKKTV